MGKARRSNRTKAPETPLRRLRMAAKLSQQEAAEKAGISFGHWQKLEYGQRQLTAAMVRKLAAFFGVEPSALLVKSVFLPVVGLGGPGLDGMVRFDEEVDEVAPPVPGGNDATVAIALTGTPIGAFATDGWLVYFDDLREPPGANELNETCVVGLPDGRVVVRTLRPAMARDRFHLESVLSAPPMLDQVVLWASLVRALVPRRQAQRLVEGEATAHTQQAPFNFAHKKGKQKPE